MKLLNVFDTLYQNEFFTSFLVILIILLSCVFFFVLLMALKDKKKTKKEEEKEMIQSTSSPEGNSLKEKEEVTFETPILSKNLEEYKKNIEKEIKNGEESIILKPEDKEQMEKEEKKAPILDQEEIEDTAVVNILIEDDLEIPKSK